MAPKEQQRRSANSVISLTQFAHAKSKGTRRAIENYKHKKQSKFNRNAGLLREYRKAMKNEGYDAGKGASRKRSLNNEREEQYDEENDGMFEESEKEPKSKKRRHHKSDPLAKAKVMAQKSKQDQILQKELKLKQKKENEKKQKQKQKRGKQLRKRTNRGQPIMKNVVGDLLQKIRSSESTNE